MAKYWIGTEGSSGCCGFREPKNFGFSIEGKVRGSAYIDDDSLVNGEVNWEYIHYKGEGATLAEAAKNLVNNYIKAVKKYITTPGRNIKAQAMRTFFIIHKNENDARNLGGNEGDCFTPDLLDCLLKIEGAQVTKFVNANTSRPITAVTIVFDANTKEIE